VKKWLEDQANRIIPWLNNNHEESDPNENGDDEMEEEEEELDDHASSGELIFIRTIYILTRFSQN